MSRMKYDIKNDVVFKTIFGQNNEFSKKALKSMAEAFIGISIDSLEFMPNEIKNGNIREKQTITDIACIFHNGIRAQIEMQMYEGIDDVAKRLQYYESKLIVSQELKGQWYSDLKGAYTIMIMNFNFEEDEELLHHYVYKDKKTNHVLEKREMQTSNIITIELPKCKKKDSALEKWSYYLKYCMDEEENDTIEMIKREDEVISMVDEKLKYKISESEKEYIQKMLEEKARYEAQIYTKERYYEEGEKRGRKEGEQKKQAEIIHQMNAKLKIEEIAEILGMDIKEIEGILKNKSNL